MSQLISPEYVRVKVLAELLDCGESTIWAKVKNGQLPPPAVKLGLRTTLWHWPSVQQFLRANSAQATSEK